MSDNKQLPDWIYNINLESKGITRKLADGINTRIFVGENTMLSVVKIESNSSGNIHSHVEEQWGFLIEGECIRIKEMKNLRQKQVTSGILPVVCRMASVLSRWVQWCWIFLVHQEQSTKMLVRALGQPK